MTIFRCVSYLCGQIRHINESDKHDFWSQCWQFEAVHFWVLPSVLSEPITSGQLRDRQLKPGIRCVLKMRRSSCCCHFKYHCLLPLVGSWCCLACAFYLPITAKPLQLHHFIISSAHMSLKSHQPPPPASGHHGGDLSCHCCCSEQMPFDHKISQQSLGAEDFWLIILHHLL